jgi:hypothetical protein
MILIDLIYVNSFGGIVLARQILDYISKKTSSTKYIILLDRRNCHLKKNYNFQIKIINNSELERYCFYKRNNFDKIFCFGNVPPPLNIAKKTFIYFHNELLLNTEKSDLSYIKRLSFIVKRFYIKFLNKNYTWLVQTELMKDKLVGSLGVLKADVHVAPFFSSLKFVNVKRDENSYIYPTSESLHKNNNRLIDSFIEAARSLDENLNLKITIDRKSFKHKKIPKNLKIDFIGNTHQDNLLDLYVKSEFLIFPSLKESFGLPLIEAVQCGCFTIVSNLNFSKEVIRSSLLFDPFSTDSIKNAIIQSIKSRDLKKPKLLVNNSIEFIFNECLN